MDLSKATGYYVCQDSNFVQINDDFSGGDYHCCFRAVGVSLLQIDSFVTNDKQNWLHEPFINVQENIRDVVRNMVDKPEITTALSNGQDQWLDEDFSKMGVSDASKYRQCHLDSDKTVNANGKYQDLFILARALHDAGLSHRMIVSTNCTVDPPLPEALATVAGGAENRCLTAVAAAVAAYALGGVRTPPTAQ